jgi:hypothetical protein
VIFLLNMTPIENDLYKTLNLLVMLSRSRRQLFPKLSEEEKATLMISKQILHDSGLTIPEFTNCLHLLGEKGYTWHMVFFDDHLRSQIDGFVNGSEYDGLIDKLKALDTPEFSDKLKASVVQDFEKIMPAGSIIDQEMVKSDDITFSQAFDEGIQKYKKMRTEEVALVLLMPFRNIEKLLEKIQSGKSFDEIQDSSIWYDTTKYEFHIGDEIIPTSYQGKPNIEHTVLEKLNECFDDGAIWFDDFSDYKPRALKDALSKFVNRNEGLKQVFTIHSDRLEFAKEAFE